MLKNVEYREYILYKVYTRGVRERTLIHTKKVSKGGIFHTLEEFSTWVLLYTYFSHVNTS